MTITLTVSSLEELESFAAALLRQGSGANTSLTVVKAADENPEKKVHEDKEKSRENNEKERENKDEARERKEKAHENGEKVSKAPANSPEKVPTSEPPAADQPEAKPAVPAPADPKPDKPAASEGGASITMVELRKRMKACIDAGHRDAVMTLLTSFGASKLSQVPEERWPEFADGLSQVTEGGGNA